MKINLLNILENRFLSRHISSNSLRSYRKNLRLIHDVKKYCTIVNETKKGEAGRNSPKMKAVKESQRIRRETKEKFKLESFWEYVYNHKIYLDELAKTLRYSNWEDWYQVTANDFKSNGGKKIMSLYNNSPIETVVKVYQEYPWKIWKVYFN